MCCLNTRGLRSNVQVRYFNSAKHRTIESIKFVTRLSILFLDLIIITEALTNLIVSECILVN